MWVGAPRSGSGGCRLAGKQLERWLSRNEAGWKPRRDSGRRNSLPPIALIATLPAATSGHGRRCRSNQRRREDGVSFGVGVGDGGGGAVRCPAVNHTAREATTPFEKCL